MMRCRGCGMEEGAHESECPLMPVRDWGDDDFVENVIENVTKSLKTSFTSENDKIKGNDEIKKNLDNVRKRLKTLKMTKSRETVENVSHGGKRAGAGRPRLYENAAERQRAYTARKKEAG